MSNRLPVLYSFRRCPYAMRSRLALLQAGVAVELREILLRDKPAAMLQASAKGTVPVLQLDDGTVLDESFEIMRWALARHDPGSWLSADPDLTQRLVETNDGAFKQALDRYKYFVRYPEHPQSHYRAAGETFLRTLETQLGRHQGEGLVRASTSLADIAIFPFVRQFAGTDPDWFGQADYPLLRRWLDRHVGSQRFQRSMKKYPLWQEGTVAQAERWD